MNPHDNKNISALVHFLERQRDAKGRANLAELRRAAADPLRDTRSIWILGGILPEADGWAFDAYRLVGTLYAIHAQRFSTPEGGYNVPKFKEDGNDDPYARKSFGESLRRLRTQLGPGQESLDQRFVALLDSDREDIAVPLRGFIQRIASAEKRIPVDYFQLLNHLLKWDGDKTKRRWARDYWQPVRTGREEDDLFKETNN